MVYGTVVIFIEMNLIANKYIHQFTYILYIYINCSLQSSMFTVTIFFFYARQRDSCVCIHSIRYNVDIAVCLHHNLMLIQMFYDQSIAIQSPNIYVNSSITDDKMYEKNVY